MAKTVTDPQEELVTVFLNKDNGKYKDDVFVAVNGENCMVKRGVRVKIKKKFADVIQQSMEQDMRVAELIDRKQAEYRSGQSSGAI